MTSIRGLHWGMFLSQGQQLMEDIFYGREGDEESGGIEVCDTSGVSNENISGDIGEIHW